VPDGCFEPAFIESAGAKNLEGRCYITFGGLPPEQLTTGAGKAFLDRYRAAYGAGDMQGYAIYGYEAGRVVVEAIRRAGRKDRDAIVAAAATIKDLAGAIGTYSFDENGDTTSAVMSVNEVRDGAFSFVQMLGK
jgi:branched-chain amino acid transport system substrate-binding protein